MKTVKAIMFWLLSLTWGALMTLCGGVVALALLVTGHKPKRFHYLIYFEESGAVGADLNSARFSSSTKTRLYISCNTKADTVYKILCSACLCLLSSVFPLVFAIGGASAKYEKDSATLYRPTIEYGLKVGQPASAKNILIDKTKTPSQ